MKKLIFLIAIVFSGMLMQAQDNFVWDQVIETKGTKSELFSKAKLVIAETYNAANKVIQNVDPETGVILAKGLTSVSRNESTGLITVTHTIQYTVKIMVKDNKYRIVIDDVHNSQVWTEGARGDSYILIPISDEPFQYKLSSKKGYLISKKKHAKLMLQIKFQLNYLFLVLNAKMQQQNVVDADW